MANLLIFIKLALNSVNSCGVTHGIGVHFVCPELLEGSPGMQLKWLQMMKNLDNNGH